MIKKVIAAGMLLCIVGQKAHSADQKQCIKNPQLNPQDRILHDAALCSQFCQAKKALENGANINSVNADLFSYTPLLTAATWRKLRMVNYVLRRGGDINAQDCFGDTALHCIAEKNPASHPKNELLGITRALLKAHIDPTIKNCNGWTALKRAQFYRETLNYDNLALIGVLSNASKKHKKLHEHKNVRKY